MSIVSGEGIAEVAGDKGIRKITRRGRAAPEIFPLPDIDALWDYDHPETTERQFRDLLSRANSWGNAAYDAELLTQVARAEGLQGRFAAAHQTLDRVEAQLPDTTSRVRTRYLLERGRVLNSAGDPARAAGLFLEAWEVGRAGGEEALAIAAAHMLGIVGPAERRLDWSLRALDLAEQSSDPAAQRWRGALLNNIGWTYHERGDYEEALAIFHRALAWREAEAEPRATAIARWAVARTLRSLGRIDEALAIQRALLAQMEERGETDGYVHEELAECLLALERAPEARSHFAAAHAALAADPWLVANEPERLQRLLVWGTTRLPHDPHP